MYLHGGMVDARDSGATLSVTFRQPVLFLNNDALSETEAIERIWHFPDKQGIVMKADKPWERFGKYHCAGGFSGKSIVVKDDKLQMFYSIYHMGDGPEFRSFAYAESKDGLKWTKPDLGDGTNLLIKNKPHASGKGPAFPYYEMQNVLWDERSGLYRAMGHCVLSKGKSGTFYASSKSPTKWNPKDFKFAYKNSDIHSLLGWDFGFYVSYPRISVTRYNKERRAIAISISKDFKKWSEPVLIHGPTTYDSPEYEIYNMPVEKVGSYLIAFPIGFQRGGHGPLDSEFAYYSWAGFVQPYGHMPFIPRGLPGEWDDTYVMTAAPVNFRGKTMFFYWGCNFPHDVGFRDEVSVDGSVGLATMPENRYCGLACPRHLPGVVETAMIETPAAHIDYDATGKVSVMAIDRLGHPTDAKKGNFKLRFEIQDGELFSFTLS